MNTRSVSGGPATQVAQGYSPAWSPRGAEIAFVRGTSLLAVDPEHKGGTDDRGLARECPEGSETSIAGPDWSPDGTRLVFAVV